MGHDPDGPLVPPRCEECNAPLTSDERCLDSASLRFFCTDCQLALNPFPARKRIRRLRTELVPAEAGLRPEAVS
jgi:hypothetical protein